MNSRKKRLSFLLAALFAISGSASAATVNDVTINSGNTGQVNVPAGNDHLLNVTNDVTVGTGAWGWVSGINASPGAIINIGGTVRALGNNTYGISTSSTTVKVGNGVTASGEGSRGIYATTNSDIEVIGEVKASGQNSMGVEVNSSEVKVSGNVEASGQGSYGIYGANSSKITVTNGVKASGTNSRGIYTRSSEVEVTGDVTASGQNSMGIEADTSTVKVTGDVTAEDNAMGIRAENSDVTLVGDVSASGQNSRGIYAYSSTVDVTGDVIASASSARGIEADFSDVKVTGSVTAADRSVGIHAASGSTITVSNGVKASGNDSRGIYAHSSEVEVAGGVTASGQSAYGIEADTSKVTVIGDVNAEGQDAMGIRAQSSTVEIDGTLASSAQNATGAYITSGSNVNLKGNLLASNGGIGARIDSGTLDVAGLLTVGADSTGIIAAGIDATANVSSIEVNGENAVGLYATNNSTINVTNGTIQSGPNSSSWIFFTDNNGAIQLDGVAADATTANLLKSSSSGTVTILNSILYGNIAHDGTNAGILETDFNNSFWMGTANATANGAINLTFGSSSNWAVTGNSNTNGSLDVNGGTVDYTTSALGTTVTVDSLSGSGFFRMKTDIFNETADLLLVEGASSGSHLVTIVNQGSAVVNGTELTTLVQTADTGSSFSLTNQVEVGPWLYDLRKVSNGHGGQYWELYRGSTAFSNPSSSAVNTFVGSYFLNYLENDTLIQRLGDLRNEKLEERNGVWARTFGGETDFDSKEMISGFNMNHWGVQAGYDHRLKNSWFKNGTTYVGGFLGVSSANLSFSEIGYGKGDVDHKSVGFYATHKANSGFYFDTVLKYVWRESEFNAVDSAGMMVDSDKIHGDGAGISLEMGRRFTIGDQSKKDGGWYVEPQVQMSFQHMNGGSYDLSNGMEIGVKSYDSMIGRAGALLGYQTNRTNIYAKLFFLKEFGGDMDIWANGQSYGTNSLDDDWIVYGIGVSHQVNPKNSLYLDIQRSSGGDFEQKWRLNGGWRIAF